jgi:hypothetical protein
MPYHVPYFAGAKIGISSAAKTAGRTLIAVGNGQGLLDAWVPVGTLTDTMPAGELIESGSSGDLYAGENYVVNFDYLIEGNDEFYDPDWQNDWSYVPVAYRRDFQQAFPGHAGLHVPYGGAGFYQVEGVVTLDPAYSYPTSELVETTGSGPTLTYRFVAEQLHFFSWAGGAPSVSDKNRGPNYVGAVSTSQHGQLDPEGSGLHFPVFPNMRELLAYHQTFDSWYLSVYNTLSYPVKLADATLKVRRVPASETIDYHPTTEEPFFPDWIDPYTYAASEHYGTTVGDTPGWDPLRKGAFTQLVPVDSTGAGGSRLGHTSDHHPSPPAEADGALEISIGGIHPHFYNHFRSRDADLDSTEATPATAVTKNNFVDVRFRSGAID